MKCFILPHLSHSWLTSHSPTRPPSFFTSLVYLSRRSECCRPDSVDDFPLTLPTDTLPPKASFLPFIEGWDQAFVQRRQPSMRQTCLSLQLVGNSDWLPWHRLNNLPGAGTTTIICNRESAMSLFSNIIYLVLSKHSHTYTECSSSWCTSD